MRGRHQNSHPPELHQKFHIQDAIFQPTSEISSKVRFNSSGTRTRDWIFYLSKTNSLSKYKVNNLAIVNSFTNKVNYNERSDLAESN